MNVFVGNLPQEVTEEDVRNTFEVFGQVESVTIIKDPYTGLSRGFGFVQIPAASEARVAINALDGVLLKGRTLEVNEVSPF